MFFFPRRNKEAEKIARAHMRPAWMRVPLMLIFFIGLRAMFSWNFERRLQQIEEKGSFWDETETVSEKDRSRFNERIRLFRGTWGMPVIAHVRKGPVLLPEKMQENTLFIGVSAAGNDAVVLLPPLVAKALAAGEGQPDPRRELERDLALCVRNDAPLSCLQQTLDELDKRLR